MNSSKAISGIILNNMIPSLIALACSITCFMLNISEIGYKYIGIIPLAFSICILLCTKFAYFRKRNICCNILYYVMVIRFVVMPTMIAFANYDSMVGISPTSDSIGKAVILMAYSCCLVMMFLELYLRKTEHTNKTNKYIDLDRSSIYLEKSNVVLFVIFISLIIVVTHLDLLTDYRFFWQDTQSLSTNASDLIQILVRLGALLLQYLTAIVFINYLSRKYNEGKKIYLILIYMAAFLNIIIVKGDNRMMMLLNALSTIIYINYLIPNKKRINNFILGFLTIIIIYTITINKTYAGNYNINGLHEKFIDMSKWLQLYFGGPREIALSIDLKKIYASFDLRILIKDMIQSINIIGWFGSRITGIEQSNALFNNYVSSTNKNAYGQIMPILGQGYFHFGLILAPIFEILIGVVCIRSDIKIGKCRSSGKIFAYVSLGVTSAFAMGLSISGYMQIVSWISIPILLILILNDKLILRRR